MTGKTGEENMNKRKTNKEDPALKGVDPTKLKKASKELNVDIDDALGLKMVGIRLPVEMIESFRQRASRLGIGYQTYIKMLLTKHMRSSESRDLLDEPSFVGFGDDDKNSPSHEKSKNGKSKASGRR